MLSGQIALVAPDWTDYLAQRDENPLLIGTRKDPHLKRLGPTARLGCYRISQVVCNPGRGHRCGSHRDPIRELSLSAFQDFRIVNQMML